MSCKFCEDYKELREQLEEKRARRKSKFVAVLREDIQKGGSVSYGSYDLNYCPSCGARLEEKKVRCIDCKYRQQQFTGQAVPKFICTSDTWKKIGRVPHVIGHDTYKPIRCDHWEPKGEGQNDGKV